MQFRPGGGGFARRKEVSLHTEASSDMTEVGVCPRRPGRNDRACRFQTLNVRWSDGQANGLSGRRTGGDDMSGAPDQCWKHQSVQRTPGREGVLTEMKLVWCGDKRQAPANDVARLINLYI